MTNRNILTGLSVVVTLLAFNPSISSAGPLKTFPIRIAAFPYDGKVCAVDVISGKETKMLKCCPAATHDIVVRQQTVNMDSKTGYVNTRRFVSCLPTKVETATN